MKTVNDYCKYIRSKNAGPFWVTMDIFCENKDQYDTIRSSKNFNAANIAKLYEVDQNLVKIFFVNDLYVIKVSVPRKVPQGDKYERDMHAGQQYLELASIPIE